MSEELLQRKLLKSPQPFGKWYFYNIGSTTIRALKRNKIIPNIDYGKYDGRKPDALIVSKRGVIAVITNKNTPDFRTEAQKLSTIKDWTEVAGILGAKLVIATDTKETRWANVERDGDLITDEQGNILRKNFEYDNPEIIKLVEKILASIDSLNSQIKPPTLVNPTDLAKQIWQDIWSVSGATPENCLYTFVEIFIFKYLSDLNVLSGLYGFEHLIELYKTNTADEVLSYYADTVRKKIKDLFPQNSVDNTTIINGTIFVSKDDKAIQGYSNVFKKILLRFRDYGKLENIHHDFKSKLFESFLKQSISKKNWGQFFTPLRVVRSIVKMIEIREGMKICDPACGVGKFLLEPLLSQLHRFYKIQNNTLQSSIKIIGYDKGFDREEQKTIILAKANMLIYFSDLIREYSDITQQFANLFNDSFELRTNTILGTLSLPKTNEYDLILTNPPYVTNGSSNLKDEIKKNGLESHYKINAMGVEGLFLEWIIRAVKPNGQAIVIIHEGILNRHNDAQLRKFILEECYINALISLPLNTFFTTNKKTYILSLTKKNDIADIQKEPVFTYLVSDIGETLDINRFDTDENQIDDAVFLYNQFKNDKTRFRVNDPRCKIIKIEYFMDNIEADWIIDKLWTVDEKISLGIMKKSEQYTEQSFGLLLQDISQTLLEYQELLNNITEKQDA